MQGGSETVPEFVPDEFGEDEMTMEEEISLEESISTGNPSPSSKGRRRETRPWGSYEVLTRGPGFQVKRLTVKPEQRLSYQWHRHRAETWTIARGIAQVTIEGEVKMLGPSESIHVPRTYKHRIANPSSIEPVEIIEVQTGDYLGEDDIVRIEDDFGRV